MFVRKWSCWTIIALTVAVTPPRATSAEPTVPTVVVRLKSIDGLLADAQYVAALVGQEEQAKQFKGLLDVMAGPKGLAGTGIDTKRPIGLYGVVTPGAVDSYGAVLIPVADEKVFVDFLKTVLGPLQAEVTQGQNGVYTVKHPAAPVEAYFTVADHYAYVTAMNKEALDAAKRVAPTAVLPANDSAVLAATVRIDQIPDLVKQLALQRIELQMSDAKERKVPGETPAQTQFKIQAVEHVARQFKSLLTDAEALQLRIAVDSRADELSAQLSLSAKPGTPLAKDIANLGSRTTTFGGFPNLALQMGVNLAVPEELRAPLAAIVDDGFRRELEKENDPAKKDLARKAFDVLGPIMKAGRFEMFAGFHGPDANGKFTVGTAIRVPDGKAVEKLARDLLSQAPPEVAGRIKLDADSIAGTSAHRMSVGKDLDADAKRLFGENAEAFIAFPREAVVATFGANAAAAVKAMLESKTVYPAMPLSVEASVSRLAGLDKNVGPVAQKVASEVFGPAPQGKDLVRVTVEGGQALSVRVNARGQIIKFGAQLNEKTQGGR
jgi:hypothetical protein